jgi:hypothetical protein
MAVISFNEDLEGCTIHHLSDASFNDIIIYESQYPIKPLDPVFWKPILENDELFGIPGSTILRLNQEVKLDVPNLFSLCHSRSTFLDWK